MPKGTFPRGQVYGLPADGSGAVAAPGLRMLAHVVDAFAMAPVVVADGDVRAYAVAFALVNLLVLPVRWGVTVGKACARLRMVPLVDGVAYPEQRGLAVTSALGRLVSWLCWPVLPAVALLTFDEDGRTLVDRATKVVVVEW